MLRSDVKINGVRFEIFWAVAMNNAVFWDVKNPGTSQETLFIR
jgi:hypothetical protein